ncbi:uncharacterized protein EI90DRAFT_172661 [Cantharellus anzutake]|uniref:uncharacterized protein n=1 Tax=Cantharellus anzutake TaxID=1750568 RepID=UPI00190708D8|nr:uncharacterized protein EI90DRAFT_172661 [Cantharellus anzutake]KAF8336417.1 hypothetical protein EI90DRAFT_172661 [Cantharellus anzutake]
MAELFSRSPDPDPTHIDQSKSSNPRQPEPSTPDPPFPNLSPSPVLPEAIDIPHMIPGEPIIRGNTETHTPPERTGVSLDTPSLIDRTPSSSAVPAGDGKKTIIAATRLVLQTATSALKFVPIPNLDQIPSILLTWLQVYETIDNNDESLKGLDDEVRNAHETIFRPLLLWTGQLPPEIRELIQQFNLALRQQLRRIEALKHQKLAKRVVLASEISQEINAVKSCISDAVSRFTTAATALNLFHTIRLSVDCLLRSLVLRCLEFNDIPDELSKFYKANAEYSAVESKSECLENTRVQIQESILDHLEKREHRFVWLRGSPELERLLYQ